MKDMWDRNKPTEPGNYWFCGKYQDLEYNCLFQILNNKGRTKVLAEQMFVRMEDMTGWFYKIELPPIPDR